jgi:adenylylsulfate kinase
MSVDDGLRALLLTGTIGSGKTALATEAGELLGERGTGTAVIDLDWLGWFHAPARSSVVLGDLIARNLDAVWPAFREAGATRVILSRMVLSASEVDAFRRALPGVDLTVTRVIASAPVIEERLRRRDTGSILEGHLVEAAAMTAQLDELGIEDLRIDNDGAPIREVALDLLRRIGWL